MSAPNEAQMVAHLNALAVDAAIQNPAFRAALLADPNGVIEKALGTALPPGVKVKVVEATPTEFTIVLPYQAKPAADGELSDSDLEAVAGGSKSGATAFFVGTFGGGSNGSDEGNAGAGLGAGLTGQGGPDGTFAGTAGWAAGAAIRAGGTQGNPFSMKGFF